MKRRINGHIRLYALIGSSVEHSGSPAMQNYSFESLEEMQHDRTYH